MIENTIGGLNTIVSSILQWVWAILANLVSAFIFIGLLGIFHPIRRLYNQFLSWVDELRKRNMALDIEMNSNIKVENPITTDEFKECIKKSLSHDFVLTQISEERFKSSSKLNSCNIEIDISAVSDETNAEDEERAYQNLIISITTKDLKLKKLKEGLGEIQNFLFRELFLKINRILIIDVEIEGVNINFQTIPQLIRFIEGLELKDAAFTGEEEDLKVVFQKNKIRFIGKIDQPALMMIDKIVRKNLFF